MKHKEITTIQVDKDTAERLRTRGKKGETYNSIIRSLLGEKGAK
jgi:hypothetical protein